MSKRQAGAEVEITPEMVEAGIDVLLDFGTGEDLAASELSLVVKAILSAMRGAAGQSRDRSC